MDSCLLSDADIPARDRAGAMRAVAIHIRSAGLVTIAPLSREDGQVDLRDGAPLELAVGGTNARVKHIHMGVLTGDAKVVIASVKSHHIIDAIKTPEPAV
jgi:hypothetical protein